MVQVKIIITFLGPDIKNRDWGYAKCQVMIFFSHSYYDHWCDRDYHNKCQIFATIIINLFQFKEGTLFCEPYILFKSLCLSLDLQIVSSTIEDFDLHFNMGGNLNYNDPFGCENWKSKWKVWRRLHRHGFTDYMEKLHGSKKTVSQGFAKGWNNNKVTCLGRLGRLMRI